MRRDAARARDLGPDDGSLLSTCNLLEGVGRHLAGDPDGARGPLEAGARGGAAATPNIQALCLAQLALLLSQDEDWERAASMATRARSPLESAGLGSYPTSALVFAISGLVRAHRGMREDARDDTRRAVRLLAGLDDFAPWYEGETRLVLARAALRLGQRHRRPGADYRRGGVRGPGPGFARASRMDRRDAGAIGRGHVLGQGGLDAHDGRAPRSAAASHAPVVPRDREHPLRLAEHGEDPREGGVPQARRILAGGGSGPGAESRPARAAAGRVTGDPRQGWRAFAAVLLAIAGVLNFILGLAAISGSDFFVQGSDFIVNGLHSWGWIIMLTGLIQFFTAFAIWGETAWGRWIGRGRQRDRSDSLPPCLSARGIGHLRARHPHRVRTGGLRRAPAHDRLTLRPGVWHLTGGKHAAAGFAGAPHCVPPHARGRSQVARARTPQGLVCTPWRDRRPCFNVAAGSHNPERIHMRGLGRVVFAATCC